MQTESSSDTAIGISHDGVRNWDSEVAGALSLTHKVREMLICEWGAFTCLTASPKRKRLLRRSLTEARSLLPPCGQASKLQA